MTNLFAKLTEVHSHVDGGEEREHEQNGHPEAEGFVVEEAVMRGDERRFLAWNEIS